MAKAKHSEKTMAQSMAEDDFDNLSRQDSNLNIDGWFTPSDQRPLPQVLKGTVIGCYTRKNPSRKQNPRYLLVMLAAPVIGFRIADDQEGHEDEMKAGEIVGIDMRQALEKLENHRDKVKLVFVERRELADGNTWWKTEVYANLTTGKTGPVDNGKNEDVNVDDLPF